MNEVVGCEAIILPTSHSPSQPLCHGPSRTARPRIQGPAPSAVTGPGSACGFAPGSPPLSARGPLPPAYGDPVAGPAPLLRTRTRAFFAATGAGVKPGSGNGWWRPVPPNGDNHVACTWPPPTCTPTRSPPVPDVTRAARMRRPRAAAGVASAPSCMSWSMPRGACWPAAPTTCWRTELRRYIVAQGAKPVISGRRHRTVPIDYDRVLYRERNLVARSIGWLKQGRRIATKRNGDCE